MALACRLAESAYWHPSIPITEDGSVTDTTHTHHAIDYIEIPVTDLARAKRFYGEAFGWTFNDYGDQYVGIRRADDPGVEAGGFRPVDAVEPGGVLVILYSEDLEESVAKVRAAGGEITAEPFEFPGGRRFHFRDPDGHELAVWSSE
jgi:predicted enzyme related to lactoylglutathione lyase